MIQQLVLQQFSVICNSLDLANYLLLNVEDKVMVSSKVFFGDRFYEPVMFLSELGCGCWRVVDVYLINLKSFFDYFPEVLAYL